MCPGTSLTVLHPPLRSRDEGKFKCKKPSSTKQFCWSTAELTKPFRDWSGSNAPSILGLDPACFDEKVTLFEIHRASINSYFCNNVGRAEDLDVARFERQHREYEADTLDEIQVYRDLQAVEDRRRIEGKAPKVRFFTEQEQQDWERQYPRAAEDVASRGTGGQP